MVPMSRTGAFVLAGRVAASAVVATALAAAAEAGVAAEHAFFRGLRRPTVIAHRGGGALRPENTLLAFRHAVALGVDVVELDVHATADGVLVVIHDPTVDRTTDGAGAVPTLGLAELHRLDAGHRWSVDGGRTFPYRGRGLRVPTFDAVLAALPSTRLVAEIKPAAAAFAAEVCRAIQAAHAAERVLVGSFDGAALDEFRRACPTVATGASSHEAGRFVTTSALPLVSAARPPAPALLLPTRWRGLPVATTRVIAAAHRFGVAVYAWTIDDEDDMRRLLDDGVDGIVTDRPDRLLRLLGAVPDESR
jgi:glycerophosphoryl diester phosphodiesterase